MVIDLLNEKSTTISGRALGISFLDAGDSNSDQLSLDSLAAATSAVSALPDSSESNAGRSAF